MKADITKNTFNPAKHFSRVMMQQGRVQLDADWNEQTSILLHYMQTLAKDLIGEHAGSQGNAAFEITEVSETDFSIGVGNYYVDGILCECEGKGEVNVDGNRELHKYTTQPYFQVKDQLTKTENTYLVYLDVWERHLTYVEDDSIREVALLGADTATRAQIVWQVKVEYVAPEYVKSGGIKLGAISDTELKNLNSININQNWLEWMKLWQPETRGLLKAKAKQIDVQDEPCTVSPDSRYRGMENQLYRVEIHKGGKLSNTDKPTFKWSRDNGSVVSAAKLNGNELNLDNTKGFTSGKWVELTSDEQELRGESGVLLNINKIDEGILYLDTAVIFPQLPIDEVWPTKARLWDSSEIEIAEGGGEDKWLILEDGVQIQFQPPQDQDNEYRVGDYWLIAARVATGDIEWSTKDGKPLAIMPHGVEHHYAPLAIVIKGTNPENDFDLRTLFKNIASFK